MSPKDGIPTLWRGQYIKHDAIPSHCYPNPEVIPELAEDSDVEVSEPTINFFLERDGCPKLHLHSYLDIKDTCVHRQRRFMHGNSRGVLTTDTMRTNLSQSIMNWYSQAAGFNYYNSDQHERVPVVEGGRLLDITGVYIFCPAKDEGHPPSLRFLRAPVDFSHNCDTAALYGLTYQDCMITSTSEWSLISA